MNTESSQSDSVRTERENHRRQFASLSQAVSGLAHEIKNPLSTIQMNLRLLVEDLTRYGDEEHRRMLRRLQRVQGEADRLGQILQDFLHYAGKVELHLQRYDLCDVVADLRDFFEPQATACKVVLRTALPDCPLYARFDVNLVKQALLNLMINATQAMAEEGGELLVRVTAAEGRAVVEVIDTGPGIAPEVMEDIFEAYVSTKPDGSGLGLPTARRIIDAHGGSLDVESEPGKGTRFVFTLPLAD